MREMRGMKGGDQLLMNKKTFATWTGCRHFR